MFTKRLPMIANRSLIYPFALALGLLQAVTFDFAFDANFRWLAPLLSLFSLLGFLAILQHLSPKRAMLFGYLFGLATFGWGINWVYISMAIYGGAPLSFAILANAGVVAYLAIYWLLAAGLITFLGKTPNQRLLLAAPIIALLEWLRAIVLSGFPWLSIGYGWVDTPISRLASFGGVFFLSFVIVLLTALLLIKLRRLHKNLLLLKYTALITIFSIPFFPLKESGQANVALIQGDMPVITQYNTQRMLKNIVEHEKLTDQALKAEKPIHLVIWPESAIPFFYRDVRDFLSSMHQRQQANHFDFISGIPYSSANNQQVYNSIFLQKQKDKIGQAQYYHKQHLLPFGEYIPLRSVFSFFNHFVTIPMADFSRGKVIQPPFVSHGIAFAPAICFEAVFGNEIRQNARNAQVLINISNDAWFGHSKAQAQHLNITRMRAIENQKMLIRATNNGLTVILAPNGKVIQSIPPFTKGILTANIKAYDQLTLYARFGDIPWLIFFAFFALMTIAISRIYSFKH